MKLSFIVFAFTLTVSNITYAYECNTVMGGCPTDTTQATSTHMRTDVTATHKATQAKAPTTAKPAHNVGAKTAATTKNSHAK